MEKKSFKNIIDNLSTNKWFYISFTSVFFVVTFVLFGWAQDFFCFQNSIQADLFGQIGDFSGGILGTIFALISTLLLIRTFHRQQQVTKENKTLIETQRFNDLFFQLLNLYQGQTKELQDSDEYEQTDKDGKTQKVTYNCNNKDFFDFNKEKAQKSFIPQANYRNNIRHAQKTYSSFYFEHKSKLAIYYRTLYRIFDLIDHSNLLEEDSKKNYAKIVRAQLTESELFFLRYNALTYYGNNFVFLLNRYNVLKHLPHFELLEFKDWWEHLTNEERSSVDVLFCMIKDLIKDAEQECLYERQQVQIPALNHSVYINLLDKSDLFIEIKIKTTKTNTANDYIGLDKFTNEQIQALLDCFLKELLVYSNFKAFNNLSDLQFYSTPITVKGHTTTILSGVRNIKQEKLHFKFVEEKS